MIKRALMLAFCLTITGFGFAIEKEPTVKEKVKETEKAVSQEKQTYLDKANKEVQEWSAKIKNLQESSEKSGVETRKKLDEHVKSLDSSLAIARKKLDALGTSSESAWTSLRAGFERTLADIKKHYQSAVADTPVKK